MEKRKPPSDFQKGLSRRLAAFQAEIDKSDEEMAEYLNLSTRQTWNNWITEQNNPSNEALIRICKDYGLSLDWFFTGDVRLLPVKTAIRLTARLLGMNPDEATPDILSRPIEVEDMVRASGQVVRRRRRGEVAGAI